MKFEILIKADDTSELGLKFENEKDLAEQLKNLSQIIEMAGWQGAQKELLIAFAEAGKPFPEDTAIRASDESADDQLTCRGAFDAPTVAGTEMMYMPAGVNTITPEKGGIGTPIAVLADRAGAAEVEAQRAALVAKNQKPYFDLGHNNEAASFWPEEFFWKDGDKPGIYARGEFTGSGRAAIEGKDFRQFSPVFHVDNKRGRPARLVNGFKKPNVKVEPNMGGLVNDPAFYNISPLWARNADGAHPSQQQNADTIDMIKTEDPAALQARNLELQKEIDTLRGEQSAIKSRNESDALVASQISARESEIKLNAMTIENESLKARNKTSDDTIRARNASDADTAIKAAVARGAIAPKDDALQARWKALLVADPAHGALLAALPGSTALAGPIIARSAGTETQVFRGRMAGIETLREYASIVGKNASIREIGNADKNKLAKEAGEIFASDMKGHEDSWMGVPLDEAIKAADSTSATIGTLAGTLVLQRNLPLLTFKFPMLQTLFSDFSDSIGLFNQTETTRIIITPAVTTYDPTLDSFGRPNGFRVVVPAQTIDVPVTLTQHVGIPMVFGVQQLAGTVRDLFGEQYPGALNALGGYFVSMATALMTPANYNAYAQITDAACGTTTGITAITLNSTAGVYPGQEISGAGIPTGARIRAVPSAGNAIMTLAATATASVVATLGGGKVPNLYAYYEKALADFNFASLGDIGAAFDDNQVPDDGRCVMLNASYYQRLAQDPTFNTFFAAMNNQAIISKGQLPQLNNFMPQKAPYFPSVNNGVGFAYHQACMALKARLPVDFTKAVNAMVPGNVTTVTDPDTKLSLLHVERVDVVGRYAESSVEAMLGANVGDRRAGMVIQSQ
jgi:hypothetical protein